MSSNEKAWNEKAIDYLRKHRDYVARDLETLRAGQIRIASTAEGDVTAAWIGRYQRQLAHLDEMIGGYERS